MERSHLLMTLLGLGQIGRHKAEFICSHSSLAIIEAGLVALAEKGLLPATVTPAAIEQAVRGATEAISRCRENGWSIVNTFNSSFPSRLKTIPDAPVLLYSQGNLAELARFPCVAVIGTRTASTIATDISYRLGLELAKIGAGVISGLALGCDSFAHRGCLEEGGYTVAVLPAGLDVIYPPQNQELAARIVENGCLLSEYPPGIQPAKYRFVERDRLQSGLSDAVVVVETETNGGAMHTARFAKRQGRRLLVFTPASLGSTQVSGNQKLLAEGAEAVGSVEDVMKSIQTMRPGQTEKIGTLWRSSENSSS